MNKKFDGQNEKRMKILVVVVANGPSFGGGMRIAPNAKLDDGKFDVVIAGNLSAACFSDYGRQLRQSVENMRKLVYAFYDPNFSFKAVISRYPEAAGLITDCLSGDVNKDFSQLWAWVREFVPLPEDLPYGEPLIE